MKILKKVGWVLLVIIGILVLAIGIFIYTSKPDYDGEKQLLGLSGEVETYFDPYGIPHIYATNEKDAFTALGYVHAQDRLWQMELLRRIGRGGISEVFGPDFIKTDKFFLALGIDDASATAVAKLDKSQPPFLLTQAYLDGINLFIAEGTTPIEFHLTGIEKAEFTLKDVYNTIGYMAFSFAMAHKTDPLLTKIRDKLGPEYLKDLQIHTDTSTMMIPNYDSRSIDSLQTTAVIESYKSVANNPGTTDKLQNSIATGVLKSLEKLNIPLFEGSNSWVIAPGKTKNGKVIFANDPHIGFSQPSVWYEAHISTPSYKKYGYHLAGVPFPLLGHDRNLAYGMTMFENDDVDFYYEETHPSDSTKYKSETGWSDYEVLTKSIKVKDSTDIEFTFKKTVHGPLLNGIADQINGKRPISMWWAYTKLENRLVDAIYSMSHAANFEEFRNALPKIHAPGLNIMYGDAKGNVAWWATAKLYQISDSINTKIVYDFGGGLPEARKYLPFTKNPHSVNPPSQYVYSANNQPDSIAGMLYPGYYLPENRAKRITGLLESKNDWDAEAVRDMMTDATSPVNPSILANLLKDIDTEGLSGNQLQGLDKLQYWKGDYPLNSVEATIFHRWIYFLLVDTLKDELGQGLFDDLQNTHLIKRLIAPLSRNESSIWWDDISTTATSETKKDIVNASFRKAWASMEDNLGGELASWTWNRVHTVEHGHPIGEIDALRPFFNTGPFPVAGTREVINNMAFSYTEDGFYKVSSGPSTRRVIDFSDVENSMSILPTGQSGNPFSEHYEDQAEMSVNGEFRKMMMNEAEIKRTSKSVLVLKP